MDEKMKTIEALGALETERLLLRRFKESDAEDMYEYAGDPEVTKYLTWTPYECVEDCALFIRNTFISAPNVYAIELKDAHKVIGAIDIRLIPEDNKASFGYCLNRAYWNNGYVSEALACIIALAFNDLNLNRVESTHYVGNEGSGRVMQKCGMMYEGLGLQEKKILGKYVDVVHYAILKHDYVMKSREKS